MRRLSWARMRLGVAAVLVGATAAVLAVPDVTSSRSQAGYPSFVVAPAGDDRGPCSSSKPCRSFDRAYRIAPAGATVEIRGGTYPAQQIGVDVRKLLAGRQVTLRPTAGASVVVAGDITVNGSGVRLSGARLPSGDYSIRARKLRIEALGKAVAPGFVTVEGLEAETLLVTAAHDVLVRDSDFGPSVGCFARGFSGTGDNGAPVPPQAWCPVDSPYAVTGNTDAFEPRIGPSGTIPGLWPHAITLDGVAIHDQNSLDTVNLHSGGLFLVSGYDITIRNSRFYGNIVYNIFAKDFTTPECCGMRFGAVRDIRIVGNRFQAPVGAARDPGGNGWTSRAKTSAPDIQLSPQNDEPWRDWVIERNVFDTGVDLGYDSMPTFVGVVVRGNIGGRGSCYPGSDGITWIDNLMTTAPGCDRLRLPYGYRLEGTRLVSRQPAADRVREAFALAAEGERPAVIARRLRARGARGFTAAFVRQILGQPLYLGARLGPPGAHPALVSREEWRRAARTIAADGG